jgi:Fic family protein
LESRAKEKTARKRFRGLVKQYFRLKTNEYLPLKSCEDIRQLYDELVLAEVIEENPRNAPDGKIFRKGSASVTTVADKEIHQGTYPESAICKEMELALVFLYDDNIPFLYRIAVYHYLLEYIHPFYDGNGRLGRFIVSDLLSQELNPLLAFRISYTITENISLYYNAFKVCNNPRNLGDVTPFLIMMLTMIKTSTLRLEEALRNRRTRLIRYEKMIGTLPHGKKARTPQVYLLLIQAGLFSENGISTKELVGFLENSFTTVKKELDLIESSHLLIKSRIGRENYYMLDYVTEGIILAEDEDPNDDSQILQ